MYDSKYSESTLGQLLKTIILIIDKHVPVPPIMIGSIYWNGTGLYYNDNHDTYRVLESPLVLSNEFFNTVARLNQEEREALLYKLEEAIINDV
jgi:hypothetical protein